MLLLLVTFVVVALHGRWLERADIWAYDWAIKLNAEPAAVRGARAPVLVAIDEASLARLGRWPWSREKLAEILDCLSRDQAGPVLLDIILAEPASSLEDAHLAQAIRHYPGRVVLPVYGVETGRGGGNSAPSPVSDRGCSGPCGSGGGFGRHRPTYSSF
ncbi:CHASE2 domain-containing protein [Azospira inquinata]|uniref:CHASE2 domain-containing protein n=1 Tax=Azospira inquinata TaxID=2785627 RepID=A0A975SLV8_9RHOO|nr:CHASE2 domain-containing protein [Azospira inquinata]QWT48668.1 CHASE2 domain-containing protein [Azospira inquinata]